MALPFDTVIAARPKAGSTVTVSSEGFGSTVFDIDDDPADTEPWARYLHGMAVVMRDTGHPVAAWEGTIASDIPQGASLSSSAALEVAAGLAFSFAAGDEIDRVTLARIGQRVENEIFGLPSGILDQLTSATARAGAALLLDCRTLETTPIQLPAAVRVVVMDTMSRRDLVDSEYADRHATCARVARTLGVDALRDATLTDLAALEVGDELGRRRATHVITENQRTLETVAAFTDGDPVEAGSLMSSSHRSLRDDYEVSGPALDQIVKIAHGLTGCLGARMTGGGFAGCAVALVDRDAANQIIAEIRRRYESTAGVTPRVWICEPSNGGTVSSH